jgi:hypothetical protein
MANILYSFVGELASFEQTSVENTPDGMRHCRPHLVDALQRKGHVVYSAQPRLEAVPYPNVRYVDDCPDEIDLVFCEWRWETYKGKSSDILRQDEILQRYHGNVPVILYDAAFQIKSEDELKWPKAVIADPSINPRFFNRKRERLFFWSDFREYLPCKDPEDLSSHVYIGNDYDRPEVFERFYVKPADVLRKQHGIQTIVYGNWVDRSAARPHPGLLISRTSNVMFGGRHSYKQSMKFLNNAIATTHLMKPEYDVHGNITVRFTESMAVGTPGLVPMSFCDPDILGKEWRVSDQSDLIVRLWSLKNMSLEKRKEIVESQKYALLSKYDVRVERAVEFIESFL